MVVGTVGILFSIPGQTIGFSVFTEILMDDLGLSRVELSTAYCIGTVGSGLTLPHLGRLYDHWGGRKMAVVSVFATAMVLFYLSWTGDLQDWIAGEEAGSRFVVVGFVLITLGFYLIRMSAQGVLTMSSRNLIGKWFDQRRGLAFSISGLVIAFVFSAAPALLANLIDRFGHEGAWRALALSSLGIMAPLAWLVFRDSPEDCGMVMDGHGHVKKVNTNPDMIIHREFSRGEALRTYAFWVFALSFSFYSYFVTSFTFHILAIGKEFGFEKADIIELFIPMAAVSVIVTVVYGLINPHTRLKWLLLAMNLGGVAGALGLMGLDSTLGKVSYIVGNGLGGGAFMSLTGLVWPRYFGRRRIGAISGVSMSLIVIASGVGPLLFGLSERFTGSFVAVFALSAAMPFLLGIGSLWANNPQRR